jgi:hypothetical protein
MSNNNGLFQGSSVGLQPTIEAIKNAVPPYATTLAEMKAAENRRETLRFEAAVNLAVAATLHMHEISEVRIYPQDLEAFQNKYKAYQTLNDDGSFTISYSKK